MSGFGKCLRPIAVLAVLAVLSTAAVDAQTSTEASEEEVEPKPEPVTVERLSDYLNSLTSAWARFTQINSDGTLSKGTLVVKRPWRARLEYDPPDSTLIVAGGRRLAIFDNRSNSEPLVYPLSRTPLQFILKDHIDLGDPRLQSRFMTGLDYSEIHLQSPSEGYSGVLIISFKNDPLELSGWTVIDEFGQRTHVSFDQLGTGIDPGPAMFDIDLEMSKLERNR